MHRSTLNKTNSNSSGRSSFCDACSQLPEARREVQPQVHVHRECKFLWICFCSCHIIPLGRENYAPPGGTRCSPPPLPLLIERSRRESDLRFGLRRRSGNASNGKKHSRNHFSFLEPSPWLSLNTLSPVLLPSASDYERLLRAFAVRSLLVLSARTRGLCIEFMSGIEIA